MRLAEIPTPAPAPGEVLVEIHASGISDADTFVRADAEHTREATATFAARGGALTGIEFAGVVRSDGATFRAGDRVMGYVHLLEGPRTHATHASIAESDMVRLPSSIDMVGGASLPTGALTALEILDLAPSLTQGDEVLVLGGSGSVGGYVVQLTASRGLRVTATTDTATASRARELGASETRTHDRPFHEDDSFALIVDTPARWTFASARGRLAKDGTYITTNPAADEAGFELAQQSDRNAGYLMMLDTSPERLRQLAALVERGVFTPQVDSVFDARDADAAFDRSLTRGKRGRVVIRFKASE